MALTKHLICMVLSNVDDSVILLLLILWRSKLSGYNDSYKQKSLLRGCAPLRGLPVPEPLAIPFSISSPLPAPPQPPHPRLAAVGCCQEPFGGDEGGPTEQPCLLEQSHLPGLGVRTALVALDDPSLSPDMP